MDIFDVLTMIGGLCLFLFGMSLMGQALERRAGNRLKSLLGHMTTNRFAGLLTGIAVTAIIQSSSATTVMVVGFVNSGLMTLAQSINVIMGANIGTTVTSWVLSLSGIDSDNFFVSLLKPSSFTPVLALAGIILFMMSKKNTRKDTGMILLGFATLMFGMETMSGAVSVLKEDESFRNLFVAFSNPVLGVLAGTALTALIQSSSASVGILQSLASTGAVTYGAAVPIIIGQHIGTCVTAMIASVGANKNARRAALVHLTFNVMGGALWLAVFCIIRAVFAPAVLSESSSLVGIAVIHSVMSVATTVIMFPFSGLLEKIVCRIIPDAKQPEKETELDERLFVSPALALAQCKTVLDRMAAISMDAFRKGMQSVERYDPSEVRKVREAEEETDRLEDTIGTYLLELASRNLTEEEGVRTTEYMKLVSDFERIADHALNMTESSEELRDKKITLTAQATEEYRNVCAAVNEIMDLSLKAFTGNDCEAARRIEPLEQVIDELKETLRTRHIMRLQRGECSVVAGFVWSDMLTNIERVSDHCSNISGCVLNTVEGNKLNIHESQRAHRSYDEEFKREYEAFARKYEPGN